MPSKAYADFLHAVDGAELLWQLYSDAVKDYHRARREARKASDLLNRKLSDDDAQSARDRGDALVQAAHVRLVTAWEVFLYDLVGEYVTSNPNSFRSVWGFQGTKKTPYGELVATIHGRPFQNADKAKGIVRKYLGRDVFGDPSKTGVDLSPVKEALVVRHAIIHRGGASTLEMRRVLQSGRKTAHSYLRSRPPGTAGIPATHFERLKLGVLAAASTLDQRAALASPRPA